jgi:phosphoribosylformylglycinamidine cyclo-ligase
MFHPAEGRGLDAAIRSGSWAIPPIFERIAWGVFETGAGAAQGKALTGAAAQAAGAETLSTNERIRKLFFNTYNMGIGFVLALDRKDVRESVEYLDALGFPAWEIGRVEPSRGAAGEVRFE